MDSSRRNETGAHRKRITRRLHQWSLTVLIICSIAQANSPRTCCLVLLVVGRQPDPTELDSTDSNSQLCQLFQIGNSERNESNLEYDNYNSSESNENKHSMFASSSSGNEEERPAPTINPAVLLRQLQKNPERIIVTPLNESKDGLAQDGSEQKSVVFVADSSGYVPITQFRGRPKHEYRESWDRESRRHRSNFTRVQHIEAECQDDYMKIRVGFNGSFTGLLYSSGYSYDPDCVYINGTGRDYYEFYIQLNRCGTLGKNSQVDDGRKSTSINKNFMWNTITVQYNPLIEEEWDEHFKVTCEYGYDFWKTVTFPFLDVEVATGNPVVFTLSPPECYMEIRYGYGTSGTRVTGPVRVGDPLTLIIYMRSKYDGFDIVVNDCFAHNGATKKIQLIDQYGCPVDDKLISRFRGSWSDSGVYETQVFAYMKTFRFTGSPALYIECDVRMCHGRCPNQPCHWRNSKTVSKRSTDIELTSNDPRSQGLSENINLFQSLRVLQEGETVLDPSVQNSTIINSVCLKYSAFSTILGFVITILCVLISSLTLVCIRLRKYQRSKTESSEARLSPKFDHKSYMIHKGRIN